MKDIEGMNREKAIKGMKRTKATSGVNKTKEIMKITLSHVKPLVLELHNYVRMHTKAIARDK